MSDGWIAQDSTRHHVLVAPCVSLASAGCTLALHFPPDSVKALARWCGEIEARVRYFRDLQAEAATAEAYAAVPVVTTAKPIPLGVRRATLAVPAAPLFRRFGCVA
jgi:hypothetical protein